MSDAVIAADFAEAYSSADLPKDTTGLRGLSSPIVWLPTASGFFNGAVRRAGLEALLPGPAGLLAASASATGSGPFSAVHCRR